MTTIQKTLIATALATAIGTGIYQARRASDLQEQTRALLLQQDSLTEQNQHLQKEVDQAENRLAASLQGADRSRDDLSNLLKLRAAVAKLRGDSQELAALKAVAASKDNDPTESEMKSWLDRVNKLKEKLGQLPDQKIPELQFLTDQDWLAAVRDNRQLKTETDFGKALSSLRNSAKNEFAAMLQNALRNYARAGDGQLPTDLSQLKPYFVSSVDDSVLQRYEFTQPGMVTEKATPLDDQDDKYFQIGMNTISSWSVAENTLQQAVQAFSAANHGESPTDPVQLMPYVKTPAEQAALQKLIPNPAGR